MKNKLTAMQVKKAGDGKLFDGGGLSLVRRGGTGKWIFRYSHLGKRREMGLGAQEEISLAKAREGRDKWAGVLAAGEDPIAVRNAQREDQRAERDKTDPTFKEMAQTVFEARKATLRGDGIRGRWFSPLELHVIPAIGKKRMSEIHQVDVRDALKPIWRTKHPTAEKAIERTRIVFRSARLMGCDCDPFTVDAAQEMLGAVDHKAQHMPTTPWQDIPALYEVLHAKGDQVSALGLRWAILTVVRGMAVRGAHQDEIDDGVWTVPASRIKGQKGKVRDFRVPLSTEALLIAETAAQYSEGNLFPGHRGGTISDVAISKMLRKTGFPGTVHGFRTSFRTWVQDNEACSYEVAETVLGHTLGNKVERSYARSDLLEPRRVVMDAWARFVTGATANVVQFSPNKAR